MRQWRGKSPGAVSGPVGLSLGPEMPFVEEQHIAGEESVGGGVGDDGFADAAAAEHRPGVEESGERANEPEMAMQEPEGERRDGKPEPGEGGQREGLELRRCQAA